MAEHVTAIKAGLPVTVDFDSLDDFHGEDVACTDPSRHQCIEDCGRRFSPSDCLWPIGGTRFVLAQHDHLDS